MKIYNNSIVGGMHMLINIPKSLINNVSIGEHRISVYLYFQIRKGLDGIVGYSCNDIVSWCGFVPNRQKGKINEKIVNTVKSLNTLGFIYILNYNISEMVNSNVYCKAEFINYANTDVVEFNIKSIDMIRNISSFTKSISVSKLLLTYLYLLDKNNTNKSIDEASIDIGISIKYIDNCLKILKNNNLVDESFNFVNKYYIYKLLNDSNDVLYVGKTKNLIKRITQHFNKGHLNIDCYNNTKKILYCCLENQTDMDVYEIYYINIYSPLYNSEFKAESSNLTNTFNNIEEKTWCELKLNNLMESEVNN